MSRGSHAEGLTYELAVRLAQAVEEYGYDAFLLPDELFVSAGPSIECWTALGALAQQTAKIGLGPYVACNSYRHPAVLAKIASTLDVISGGRLHFYLGACGWGQEVTHRAYGLPYGNLRERVARLKEAIKLIRLMWGEAKASFHGSYYTLVDAMCEPKPIQKPLEIWTGGSSDLLIEAAAEVADGWDTGFCTLAGFVEMSAKLDRACEAVGRDPNAVKRSMHWHSTLIGRNQAEVEDKKSRFLAPILEAKSRHPTRWIRELPVAEYTERRFLCGTPEECVEVVSRFREQGCDRFNFVFPDAFDIQPIGLFAEGVLSRLK
jgi:alkanesulfonate monooxygenase SsuD/methylene tetrahydromethanopterin reductase-like flavin-dependent oxidoreductase (luciferase family)